MELSDSGNNLVEINADIKGRRGNNLRRQKIQNNIRGKTLKLVTESGTHNKHIHHGISEVWLDMHS